MYYVLFSVNYHHLLYPFSLFLHQLLAKRYRDRSSAYQCIAQPKTMSDSLTHDHNVGILCVTSYTAIKLTRKLSIHDRHGLAVETHGSYNFGLYA